MENSDKNVKKEAPGVTGRQQITDKDGRQMNLKDEGQTGGKGDTVKDTTYGSDKTPTRKEKEQSKEDTAGSSLPGHQNPGRWV